ncbi:transcriptional Coactivator p15-domain-containing protein [Chytriomyces sp. MP71]|nr:transcriptional Coactivator p15-domain-containing protein [Chytriomyces sp. MP71]
MTGTKRKDDDFIDDDDTNEVEQASKKTSIAKKNDAVDNSAKLFQLSNKKRARLSEFKGHKYADIREYYEEKGSGEWKPTKKGVTLNKAELQELQKVIGELIEGL